MLSQIKRKKVIATVLALSGCCIIYGSNEDVIINMEMIRSLQKNIKEYSKLLKSREDKVDGHDEKIVEHCVNVIGALAKNNVFNVISTIIDGSGKILEKKMADMREEAEKYQMITRPEDYILRQSFFNEIKKKTIKIQQFNNAQ